MTPGRDRSGLNLFDLPGTEFSWNEASLAAVASILPEIHAMSAAS